VAITTIFKNMKEIRTQDPSFIAEKSWKLKKVFYTAFMGFMITGLLIYLGEVDIVHKNKIEYGIVTTTYLFYWTFVEDFKKYTLDIDKYIDM
jgi:hypothetical protein